MCVFSENDVDGETVDCGLTEAMIGYLFDGSFKKQVNFQQFVRQLESETIVRASTSNVTCWTQRSVYSSAPTSAFH